MSLLSALIIGALVGILVDLFLHGHIYNFFLNTIVGIIGSIVGLALFFFLFSNGPIGFFSLTSSLCSIIVALSATLLVNGLQAIASQRTNDQPFEDTPDEEA